MTTYQWAKAMKNKENPEQVAPSGTKLLEESNNSLNEKIIISIIKNT